MIISLFAHNFNRPASAAVILGDVEQRLGNWTIKYKRVPGLPVGLSKCSLAEGIEIPYIEFTPDHLAGGTHQIYSWRDYRNDRVTFPNDMIQRTNPNFDARIPIEFVWYGPDNLILKNHTIDFKIDDSNSCIPGGISRIIKANDYDALKLTPDQVANYSGIYTLKITVPYSVNYSCREPWICVREPSGLSPGCRTGLQDTDERIGFTKTFTCNITINCGETPGTVGKCGPQAGCGVGQVCRLGNPSIPGGTPGYCDSNLQPGDCNTPTSCGADSVGKCGALGGCYKQDELCYYVSWDDSYTCIKEHPTTREPLCVGSNIVTQTCIQPPSRCGPDVDAPPNTPEWEALSDLPCCETSGGSAPACNKYGGGYYTCGNPLDFEYPDISPTNYSGPTADISELIAGIYRIIVPIAVGLGIYFIITNGYCLMTTQGDPNKVQNCKEGLTAAISGLLFILLASTILRLIITSIFNISV